MGKTSAIKIGAALVAAILGGCWLWYLSLLCKNQGIVHMPLDVYIFDMIAVASLGMAFFVLKTNFAISALGGWLGGQFILLVWDGMPHGRSPQMFQPTNFGEAFVLALFIVFILNWAILPGALLGGLLRYLFHRASARKNSAD